MMVPGTEPRVPAEARGTRTLDHDAGSDVDAGGVPHPDPQPRANANARALTGLIVTPQDRLTKRRDPDGVASAAIHHPTELPGEQRTLTRLVRVGRNGRGHAKLGEPEDIALRSRTPTEAPVGSGLGPPCGGCRTWILGREHSGID